MTFSGTSARAGSVTVAALAGALLVTGCGASSSGGGNSTGPATGTSAATSPSASAPQSVAQSAPQSAPQSGAAATADAATTAAVKNAFAKFFSPSTPENVSLGLLQNGEKFKATIEQQASGSMAGGASVQVSKVALASANTASVTYTIYVNKQALLPNTHGYAVRTNGTWQVSEFTFCSLLTLEGNPPAECKTPTATQTPQ